MINLVHKPGKQKGFALLATALIIMSGIALTALIVTKSVRFENNMVAKDYKIHQAFQAAEAGLEYGVTYLNNNKATIAINDPLNTGYIPVITNSQITNVSFQNNTTYSITFSNPVANNFSRIKIVSVGTSQGTDAIRTVSQVMQRSSFVATVPPAPLVVENNVNLGGNVTITNTTGKTIWSGGTTSLSGAASTSGQGGVTSNSSSIKSDVSQNSTGLSSLSSTQFFSDFFGTTPANAQQNADVVYTNTSNTNYSSLLNGVTGKSIWINQPTGTASLSGNLTIGSAASPVTLVVDGSFFKANGSTTIYGLVYILGDWNNSGGGNLTVNGAAVIQGSLTGTGTPNITYNPTILSTLQNNNGTFYKIPGSWLDY